MAGSRSWPPATTPSGWEFLGSPTIFIDGRDPFPESGATPGLSYRAYRTDASLAGAPTVTQLRAALADAG